MLLKCVTKSVLMVVGDGSMWGEVLDVTREGGGGRDSGRGVRLSCLIARTTIRLAGNISNMLSYTCSTITKQSFIFGNSAFISTITLKTQIYKKKNCSHVDDVFHR